MLVDVTLEIKYHVAEPPSSVAKCKGRLTKTQLIIESGTVIHGRSLLRKPGEIRFWRKNGGRVGGTVSMSWTLDDESRKKIAL